MTASGPDAVTTAPAAAHRPGPLSRSSVYYAVAAVAAFVALALFVSYASTKSPIKVGSVTQSPEAKTFHDLHAAQPITVAADVTNRSSVARCPQVRAAARDVNAKDLDEIVAQPLGGATRIEPGQTQRYQAVISTLTLKDEREKLKNVVLYAYSTHRC